MSGPFTGLRILDFTRFLAGPNGTFQFALQGADVIKVESVDGDEVRSITTDARLAELKMAPAFAAVNAGKRSIVVDLRRPEGVAVVKELAAGADIVWENFRPGVMDRFGLGYEVLAGINPRLVYCSVSGFGHGGPDSAVAAFDGKIQAMSGIMSLTGDPSGGPMRAGFAVCDQIAAMTGAFAVAAAVYERTRTGRGQFVDVSMLDSTLSFLGPQVVEHTMLGVEHEQFGNLSMTRKVTAHRFRAGDGYILLAVLSEKQFGNLLRALGRADALGDPRFADWASRAANEAALRELIETAMADGTALQWEEVLVAADVPCASVRTIPQAAALPQLRARSLLQEVPTTEGPKQLVGAGFELDGRGGRIAAGAPWLGEHTVEVLREAGFDAGRIEALLADGIVRQHER